MEKLTLTQDEALQTIVIPWSKKRDAEVVYISNQFPEGQTLPASHLAVLGATPMKRILTVSPSRIGHT